MAELTYRERISELAAMARLEADRAEKDALALEKAAAELRGESTKRHGYKKRGPMSEETKAKISASNRKTFASRRKSTRKR